MYILLYLIISYLSLTFYRTVAAALNSLSAVTCEDLLISGLNIKITPEKGAYYAKWMSLG
jgi:solute carrier family 5 (sodium-coupled monocarboxylate transporter), member 8/12